VGVVSAVGGRRRLSTAVPMIFSSVGVPQTISCFDFGSSVIRALGASGWSVVMIVAASAVWTENVSNRDC
jgi:hypothetical protein